MKRIYLAGPDVFLPEAPRIFKDKIALCAQYGCTGVTPFDNEIMLHQFHPSTAGEMIFHQNIALINQCDGMVANITPFRGVHLDPGTAFEMGYAYSRGMPVAAYTYDLRPLVERMQHKQTPYHHHPSLFQDQHINMNEEGSDRVIDQAGCLIENFGFCDNLMVVGAVRAQGRNVMGQEQHKKMLPGSQYQKLEHFEQALRSVLGLDMP